MTRAAREGRRWAEMSGDRTAVGNVGHVNSHVDGEVPPSSIRRRRGATPNPITSPPTPTLTLSLTFSLALALALSVSLALALALAPTLTLP